MQRGIAEFTLDWGKCPPWLFERMVKLVRIIVIEIIDRFGADKFLERLSDPIWFQSLGCLLAFDWNASGLTTTLMGALKYAVFGLEKDLGVFICGGKGKTSRKTPDQILEKGELINTSYLKLKRYIYLSKLTAKVDSALIQDGFQIYHHNFVFTKKGNWAVIQQGMNVGLQKARRYHWFSQDIKDLTVQPHKAIQSEVILPKVLNLVNKKSLKNREGIINLIQERKNLFFEIKRIKRLINKNQLTFLNLSKKDFDYHPVINEDFTINKRLEKGIDILTENRPKNFEKLLMSEGVGPKTIRALALISEIVFGAKPSFEDPVRYSFAFGGKDGVPYPVDKKNYDKTLEIIEKAVKKSSLSFWEKEKILRKAEKIF